MAEAITPTLPVQVAALRGRLVSKHRQTSCKEETPNDAVLFIWRSESPWKVAFQTYVSYQGIGE
jgi:hypothetical protein